MSFAKLAISAWGKDPSINMDSSAKLFILNMLQQSNKQIIFKGIFKIE